MNQVDSKEWVGGSARRKFLVSASEVNPAMANLSRLALIVFVIVTISVWYYYTRYTADETKLGSSSSLPAGAENRDPSAEALRNQGASDEVGAIESDLNSTDLNDLDRELGNINAALR